MCGRRLDSLWLLGHRLGQQRTIELRLSAGYFLGRIAVLIQAPCKHRQRCFGVLAQNSPWWATSESRHVRCDIAADDLRAREYSLLQIRARSRATHGSLNDHLHIRPHMFVAARRNVS